MNLAPTGSPATGSQVSSCGNGRCAGDEEDFFSETMSVPQRGQLVIVRAGESGNPQLVHFMFASPTIR